MTAPPSARFQLRFLQDLQRVLDEGQFTASYKFALLHALADLAVRTGDDSGDALTLPTREIAERFVELYWRQVAPWPGAEDDAPLAQNTGRQAAIVSRVRDARRECGDRMSTVRIRGPEWSRLVGRVDRVVREMPLWRLQVVGGEVHDFLYAQAGEGREIILRPGIAYCLRAFYPLVIEMVQGAWARFLRKQNASLLGEQAELRDFLFGVRRGSLSALQPMLRDIQHGLCFYCEAGIQGEGHVDHFIPWSRYPIDLGHNFVLAHEPCNLRKSDHLAAEVHLERWALRNEELRYELPRVLDEAEIGHDLTASVRIAGWAYRAVAERKGFVWKRGTELVPLESGWERHLSAVPPTA